MSDIFELLEHDQENLLAIAKGLPHFNRVVPVIDGLYDRSLALIRVGDAPALFYGKTLLLCHKAFLCAALTIGRRHPDDAAAITRRAIEAVSIARAVKYDAGNLERWQAYEKRLARWQARTAGERPSPFNPDIKYPPGHPLLEEIRRFLGTLSDSFVHFTPEFFDGRGWKTERAGEGGELAMPYMEVDQRIIERELIMLGGIHVRILDLLDECFDGAFVADGTWRERREQVVTIGDQIAEHYFKAPDPNPEPKTEG
jgi:hypothetical protein